MRRKKLMPTVPGENSRDRLWFGMLFVILVHFRKTAFLRVWFVIIQYGKERNKTMTSIE